MSSELRKAVLQALQPRNLRERARVAILGGFTAVQVLERLPEGVAFGERRALDAVAAELRGLVEAGQVRRRTSSYGAELRGKGHRKVLVDLYRI